MSLFVILQTALTTPGFIGLIALVAFVAVYIIRKKFGPQWEKLASVIPALNFDLTPGLVILSKFVQALPSVLIAAAIGAATSGASLGPTLLAALAGLLAPLGHELIKAVPFIPYRGETGEAKLPGAPKLPTGLTMIVLALAVSMFGCSAGNPEPCSPADKAEIMRVYSVGYLNCFNDDSTVEQSCIDNQKAIRAKNEEKCR